MIKSTNVLTVQCLYVRFWPWWPCYLSHAAHVPCHSVKGLLLLLWPDEGAEIWWEQVQLDIYIIALKMQNQSQQLVTCPFWSLYCFRKDSVKFLCKVKEKKDTFSAVYFFFLHNFPESSSTCLINFSVICPKYKRCLKGAKQHNRSVQNKKTSGWTEISTSYWNVSKEAQTRTAFLVELKPELSSSAHKHLWAT